MSEIFGYGFDVWMFAVGAEDGTVLRSADGLLIAEPVFDRLQNDRGLICDGGGVCYDITTAAREFGGVRFLRQTEKRQDCPFAYPWMEEEELADLRPMIFDAEYSCAFEELLCRIMETSPVGKVYVQIRCQGLEQSNLCGTWTPARFMERIVRAGQLWGNMTYVLAKNADEPQDTILNQMLK